MYLLRLHQPLWEDWNQSYKHGGSTFDEYIKVMHILRIHGKDLLYVKEFAHTQVILKNLRYKG